MTTQQTNAALQGSKLDIAQRAASAFMLIEISIGTWSGVKLNRAATAEAAQAAGANGAGRLYVDLLGSHQCHVKAVCTAYRKLRDYLYSETLPFTSNTEGQRRGARLIPVTRVPEVLTKLNELAAAANDARDVFLSNYDQLAEQARAYDLGSWADGVTHPDSNAVRGKFYATVSPPSPLAIANEAQLAGLNLPAGISAEIAARHADAAVAMLDTAKGELLAEAQVHAERLHKQLTVGQRLHDSLLTDTKRYADLLKSFAEGTDHDPRLLETARQLRKECVNVSHVGQWSEGGTRRSKAAEAAGKAAKTLKKLTAEHSTPAPSPAPQQAAASDDGVQVGGMLADLW